jgi:hypothetical protein
MNDLVPFEHGEFRAQQACWTDARSVRFPRSEVGRIFGATAKRPENLIDNIIKRYPNLSSLGTAVMVTAIHRKRAYSTTVFDFREIYTLAIHSDLPGAREYLLKFPALLEAEIRGRLFAPGLHPLAQYVEGVFQLPKHHPQRIAARREALAMVGCHHSTFDRWVQRRRDGQAVGVAKKRVGTPFKNVPEETRVLAKKLCEEIKRARIPEIYRALDGKVSTHAIWRYRKRLREGARAA